jgi:hypothetical protein
VFKFGDSIYHCSLTKYRLAWNFTLLDSPLQDVSFDVRNSDRKHLSFREKLRKLKKNSYFVFKFANSIDHCSFTKYRRLLNFKLLDCLLQDAPFDV